jgi:putative membrane protein insertion efficiency factor
MQKILSFIGFLPKILILFSIRVYQLTFRHLFPTRCRFSPTCSEYSLEAIKKYGILKGVVMSVHRISKCHPFHPGGYDPVS